MEVMSFSDHSMIRRALTLRSSSSFVSRGRSGKACFSLQIIEVEGSLPPRYTVLVDMGESESGRSGGGEERKKVRELNPGTRGPLY